MTSFRTIWCHPTSRTSIASP